MDSFKINKRLGIKVPRSTLLPPYLSVNPYFVEYSDSIDAVFGPLVDAKIETLSNIRNMWVQNTLTEAKAATNSLVDNSEWSIPDRDLVVKQVNMLGMKLQNAGVVSDDAYQTISRFVGLYWFGKGTVSFIDFINYCLSSDLRVVNMWTQNYVDFYPEGDSDIGTPVWEGGDWYPTTHVTIVAQNGLFGLDIATLQSFFYEIANYNLVLRSIDLTYDMPIIDFASGRANVVAIGLYEIRQIVIANFKNLGASPPPTWTQNLPSTYYAANNATVDFNTAYLLAEPSGWMYVDDDKKVPVYSDYAQQVTLESDIGVQLLGYEKTSNQFDLLYGPITWIKIPGSSRSTSRIPAYTTSNFTIKNGVSVEAQAVGMHRTLLLTNPLGFYELNPGQFVPYW